MLHATSPQGTRKKGPTRFPGIIEFTRLHGLDRTHVWRVLIGKRESARLRRDWAAFQASKSTPEGNA